MTEFEKLAGLFWLEWFVLPYMRINKSIFRARKRLLDWRLTKTLIRLKELEAYIEMDTQLLAELGPLVAKAKADHEAAMLAAAQPGE